jgi:hypothetical protein
VQAFKFHAHAFADYTKKIPMLVIVSGLTGNGEMLGQIHKRDRVKRLYDFLNVVVG